MKKILSKASLVLSGIGALVFGLTTNAYADVIAPTSHYYLESPVFILVLVIAVALLLVGFIAESKKGEEKGDVKEIINDNLKAKEMPIEEVAVGSAPEKPADEKEEEKEEKE